ncbi:MAG TPA: lipocalin-like domain-containing protein [Candidatus Saccharimonadales bacterium]|nr:lipocalin-like domain-containing protein [Candidatus Saccharimonadales bacterium]
MKSRAAIWVVVVLLAWPAQGQYKSATPGYRYEFPQDHFNHEEFQTEWWYYTGNLTTGDGHKFGFELTFFRQGVDRSAAEVETWDVRDVYLAHLALSDLDGGKFYHAERINRAGPGIAGVSAADKRIWNGNWSARWHGDQQQLNGMEDRFSFSLELAPQKQPIIHGEDGISQKSAGAGHASHYISLTRLKTEGTITLLGKTHDVSGLAWMDHEFFTEQLAADQSGWDWFSVQLSDNTELMLYRMRKKDGSMDSFSSGTFVNAKGQALHLSSADFAMTPAGESWKSPETGATYPMEWSIAAPKLALHLKAGTNLKAQELASRTRVSPNYWEGAMRFEGTHENAPVHGVGYLEMTGYDAAVVFSSGGKR